MKRGFTLVEMVVAMALFSVIMISVLSVVGSVGKRLGSDVDESRLRMEMNYTLDTVKLYLCGASKIDPSTSFPSAGAARSTFLFLREKDVNTITSTTTADDVWYSFTKDDKSNIVLLTGLATGVSASDSKDVMVSEVFKPAISFKYTAGNEPNFIEVTVTGKVGRGDTLRTISKTAGVRLWFSGVVQ